MSNGKIVITAIAKTTTKHTGDGVCRRCGSKLVTEKSKRRGIGHKCSSKETVMLVLNIQARKENG